MYILVKSDGTSYYLKKNKSYTVGRIDVDIVLDDKAVSRRHAEIIVRNNIVLVKDLKSSNGTSINGSVIIANTETELKECQEVKFGNKDSIFILKWDALVVTTSSISESEKHSLKNVVEKMNGSIAVKWSEQCTHVVASSFVLTIKVLSALMLKQAIVTCEYFVNRLRAIEQNVPLPDPKNYRPKVLQENLRSINQVDYDADRSRLFENKTFVFPSVEKMKMESVIKMAGGRVVCFDSRPIPKNRLLAGVETEYLFVISNGHSQSDETEFNKCVAYIHRHGKRSIPMQEIAMALLICSCKVDCNPNYNRVMQLMSGERPQIDTRDVLVEETQSQAGMKQHCTNKEIPATFDGDTPVIVIDDDDEPVRGEKRGAELLEDSICKKKKPDSDRAPNEPNIPKSVDEPECSTSTKRKSEETSESANKKSKFTFKERKVKPSINEVSLSQVTSSGDTKKDRVGKPLLASTQIEEVQFNANDSTEERISPIKKKPKFPPNPFADEPKTTDVTVTSKFQDPFEIPPSTSKDVSFMSSTKIGDAKASLFDKSVRGTAETKSLTRKKSKFDFDDSEPVCDPVSEEITAPTETTDDSNLQSTRGHRTRTWLSRLPDKSSDAFDKMDDEMREFVRSFQTNVKVVSVGELIVRTPMSDMSVNRSVESSNTGGLRNFKKFKKIRPKHEQSRILPKTAFQKFVCNSTVIVANFQDQSDLPECIEVLPTSTSPKKSRNAKNKFQLNF